MQRLSGLQDDQAVGRGAAAKRCPARRKMSELWQPFDQEIRTLRRVCGVQQLSDLQIRQAENDWREVSELQRGRGCRAALETREDILRVQSISGLRFRGVGQADSGEMSAVRRQLYDRKISEGRGVRAMP